LFPDNVIGSEGRVSAILDLEEAWIGPMAFDLAMACVGFGWDGTVPVWERWKALFDGYQSVRKLTQDEVNSLPFLHHFATLSIAAWRFWKHNLSEPDEFLSDRYVEMVDRLSVEIDFSGVIG
jgi:Ser/Thr protein kinase RdoA (MazF antagonist)